MHSNRKGFTLIELLIVVVIIGILAMIAIPKFSAFKDQAKRKSVQSDVRNYMTAQAAYFGTYNTYAADAVTMGFQLSEGNEITDSGASDTGFNVTIENSTITADPKSCSVVVGDGIANDGVIQCGVTP